MWRNYTINLANPELSQVKYEKIKYPDGQISLKVNPNELSVIAENKSIVQISSRLQSYEDLFYILSLSDILKHNNIEHVDLYLSVVLAQRSDRRFEYFQSFDLKILIQSLLTGQFTNIGVFHPHSDAIINIMDSLGVSARVKDNSSLVYSALSDIKEKYPESDVIFVSPDAGAYKQTAKLAEKLKIPLVAANKHRDEKGPHTEVTGDVKGKICVIIDDYCDGGRTFINLSEKLRLLGADFVILVVSHGLFSAGLDELKKHIDFVYTTNSIKESEVFETKFIKRISVI